MSKKLQDVLKTLGALMLALFLVAGLAACTADTAEDPSDDEAAEAMDDAMDNEDSDTDAGLNATMAIDDVSIGNELNEEGAIAFGKNDDDFAPGETAYVAMEVGDAEIGSSVELVWYGPDGMEAGSDSKIIADGMHYLNFAVDTTGWPVGTYRGEVWYDNELVNEFEMNLEEGASDE